MVKKSKPGPFFKYISPEGLEKLLDYKYTSGESTPLDNALQPFWCWFVELMPMVR